jgi:hypothetical protein
MAETILIPCRVELVNLYSIKKSGTGGAVHRHWWRSALALVAQCTGTGGAVYRHWWRSVPALVAQCVKGLLPR